MVRNTLLFLILFVSVVGYGQTLHRFGFSGNFVPTFGTNQGTEVGISGGGVSFNYTYAPQYLSLFVDGNWAVSHLGNEVTIGTGVGLPFAFYKKGKKKKWFEICVYLKVNNGVTLFRPSPMYTFQGAAGVQFEWSISKKMGMYVDVSGRYSYTPDYKEYSSIFSFWQMPVALGFHWTKKKYSSLDDDF